VSNHVPQAPDAKYDQVEQGVPVLVRHSFFHQYFSYYS
jgi:hypothetical protein